MASMTRMIGVLPKSMTYWLVLYLSKSFAMTTTPSCSSARVHFSERDFLTSANSEINEIALLVFLYGNEVCTYICFPCASTLSIVRSERQQVISLLSTTAPF
ncbi:hypothetical protein BJ165DRAFT_1107691 [Panaeolus papilionaceus]|nr:hypothetical protein BJ165DRAFT_1107691 [Panaeolus papilionaceus]